MVYILSTVWLPKDYEIRAKRFSDGDELIVIDMPYPHGQIDIRFHKEKGNVQEFLDKLVEAFNDIRVDE